MMTTMGAVATMGMIGAADRLERLDDIRHLGAQPDKHVPDDVIALDQDAVGLDLGGEMPVAQMPGQFDQVERVAGANFEQPFFRRLDLDRRPVLEQQPIAVMKEHGLLEVEHDHVAIVEMQQFASQVTAIMGKNHHAVRRVGDGTGGFEGSRALHEISDMTVF
jgi:hypothetical protein